MNIDKLNFLKARRERLSQEIALRRGQLATAERYLALVSKLEDSIDEIIANSVSEPVPLPNRSEYRTEEDTVLCSIGHEPEVFEALDGLKADLPLIRAHWESIRNEALA